MLEDPPGDQKATRADRVHSLEPIPRQVLSIGVHLGIVAVRVPVDRPLVVPALPMPDGRRQAHDVEVQADQIQGVPNRRVVGVHRQPEVKALVEELPDDVVLVVLIGLGGREPHIKLITPVVEEQAADDRDDLAMNPVLIRHRN